MSTSDPDIDGLTKAAGFGAFRYRSFANAPVRGGPPPAEEAPPVVATPAEPPREAVILTLPAAGPEGRAGRSIGTGPAFLRVVADSGPLVPDGDAGGGRVAGTAARATPDAAWVPSPGLGMGAGPAGYPLVSAALGGRPDDTTAAPSPATTADTLTAAAPDAEAAARAYPLLAAALFKGQG